MANNTKMNISYTIKAIDRFTATHQKLTRQLSSLQRQLDRVAGNYTVDIDADTASAVVQLARVNQQVNSLPQQRTINIVTRIGKDFRQSMNRISDFSRDIGEIGQGMGMGAIFTVLAPTVMTLAGGLGALASAATPAMLGLAGLAAVAIPAITKIATKYSDLADARQKLAEAKTEKEIAKATEKLNLVTARFTETELKAADALDQFNKFYSEFSAQFNAPVLQIFTNSLGTAQNLLTVLTPAIQGTATAVDNLLTSLNQNIEADDMKTFFAWVGETAGPNLEKLIGAVGNFLAGFGNMMVAFDPLAQSFMDGLLNMSESFREWTASLGENQAFQDFIAFVQENGPTVLQFFGNLVKFLWNLIEAMAPFATHAMTVANSMMEWFNGMMQGNETFSKLVGWVLTFVSTLGFLLAPLALAKAVIFAALGPTMTSALMTGLANLARALGGTLLNAILAVSRALFLTPWGAAILAVIGLAMVIYSNWDAIKSFTINTWRAVSDFVNTAVSAVLKYIEVKFPALFRVIQIWMKAAGDIIDIYWDYIKSTFKNVLSFLKSLVKGDFQGMKDAVSNQMELIESTISKIWSAVKTYFSSVLSEIKSTVSSKFAEVVSATQTKMNEVKSKVQDGINKVLSYLGGIDLSSMGSQMIQGLINGIKSMAGNLVKAASGVVGDAIAGAKALLKIKSPSKVFFEFGEFVDKGFINGMLSMTRKVQGASEKMVGSSIPQAVGFNTPSYRGVNLGSPSYTEQSSKQPQTQATVTNHIVINATIREDADVQKIIDEMEKRRKREDRAKGIWAY